MIGRGTCSVCRRVYGVNATGVMRHHRSFGHRSPVCAGAGRAQAIDAEAGQSTPIWHADEKTNAVQLVVQLRGGRIFRCIVPLGVDDVDRGDMIYALELVVAAMHNAMKPLPGATRRAE